MKLDTYLRHVPCAMCLLISLLLLTSCNFGGRNDKESQILSVFHAGSLSAPLQKMADIPLVSQITGGALKKLKLKVGQVVWASFKATSVRFIRK